MQSKRQLKLLVTALTVVFGLLNITAPLFAAAKEKVLYSFTGGIDGSQPLAAGVIFDAAGNLYGTTVEGGSNGSGTVFRLAPRKNGKWKETVLYSFTGGADGSQPWAGLIFDAAGNLYGTTIGGGNGTGCQSSGYSSCGTAFELSPGHNGKWTETVLYNFGSAANGSDGFGPIGGLIFDAAGNLYGMTEEDGGTIFQLVPGSGGTWTENAMYHFCSLNNCTDGIYPFGGLIFDAAGNLYGTTTSGGMHYNGVAFQLAPGGGGTWTETVLHSFGLLTDGSAPSDSLIFDAAGNLYGTTDVGGTAGWGTIFQLTPGTDGIWTENILYNFPGNGKRGAEPLSSLIFDASGNLYTTTVWGGPYGPGACGTGGEGCGTVVELSPGGNGNWTEKVLHSFGKSTDAQRPYSDLVLDKSGNLYGTTYLGGAHGYGAVFEVTP